MKFKINSGVVPLLAIALMACMVVTAFAVSPPTVTSVSATPATAYANDTLIGNATCTDPDVGDTLTAYWAWYLNGAPNVGGVVVVINDTNTNLANISGAMVKGDNWTFGVFCGDGTANSSESNATTLTINNSMPVITGATVNVTIGTSHDFKIVVYATDTDGTADLVAADFNGLSAAFIAGTATVDISDILIQNGTLTINDTSGTIDTMDLNFSLTNNSYVEYSFAHNLSWQEIMKNDSITNLGTDTFHYHVMQVAPVGAANASVVFDASVTTGVTVDLVGVWYGDWLTETVAFLISFQNTSATSTLTTQYVTNQTYINVVNSKSFDFTNVLINATCPNNNTLLTAASGTHNLTTNCSYIADSGDWLAETVITYLKTQNSSATSTFDTQYIRNQTYVTVTNSKAFTFTGVSYNATCPNNNSLINIGTGLHNLTTNCTWTYHSGDFLAETFVQNSATLWFLTTTNSMVDFSAVSIGTKCWATYTQTVSTVDVPTSGLTDYAIGCTPSQSNPVGGAPVIYSIIPPAQTGANETAQVPFTEIPVMPILVFVGIFAGLFLGAKAFGLMK